jgi:pyruvate kinase
MSVARLNFSHGDHKVPINLFYFDDIMANVYLKKIILKAHGEVVGRLREAFKQRKDSPVALMLDTKGPEIRTGFLKEGLKTIKLKAGQQLTISIYISIIN